MNEYLKVWQISQHYKQTPRNVRKIAMELSKEKSEELIHKDINGEWQVHKLLLGQFKPQRSRKEKSYALTIDPIVSLSEREIDEIMKFVVSKVDNPNVEIHYTIEDSKLEENIFKGKKHIHCIINCSQRKKMLEAFRLGFSNVSYRECDIFDLAGWKNYITKDGSQIKTIKNYD